MTTAILSMSDLHYGAKTTTFGPVSFKNRLDELEETMAVIARQRRREVDRLVVAALGDWNDGTGIYPTQPHHQGVTNVDQQADELAHYVAPFILALKKQWGNVEVYAVPGNHGRVSKFAHEAASWDIVCYRYLSLLLGDKVKFHLPKAEPDIFAQKFDASGRTVLLYHGHEIRSYQNIPWYGMMNRLQRWQSTTVLAPFDVVMMGHFHTLGSWKLNKVDLFLSGTMKTNDSWALMSLGWESAAAWWLIGVNDAPYIPWQYVLRLDTPGAREIADAEAVPVG